MRSTGAIVYYYQVTEIFTIVMCIQNEAVHVVRFHLLLIYLSSVFIHSRSKTFRRQVVYINIQTRENTFNQPSDEIQNTLSRRASYDLLKFADS